MANQRAMACSHVALSPEFMAYLTNPANENCGQPWQVRTSHSQWRCGADNRTAYVQVALSPIEFAMSSVPRSPSRQKKRWAHKEMPQEANVQAHQHRPPRADACYGQLRAGNLLVYTLPQASGWELLPRGKDSEPHSISATDLHCR